MPLRVHIKPAGASAISQTVSLGPASPLAEPPFSLYSICGAQRVTGRHGPKVDAVATSLHFAFPRLRKMTLFLAGMTHRLKLSHVGDTEARLSLWYLHSEDALTSISSKFCILGEKIDGVSHFELTHEDDI